MFVRKALLAVAALGLAFSTTSAGAEEGLGVATSFAGSIACSTLAQSAGVDCKNPIPDLDPGSTKDDRVGTEEITGKCTYVGVTTLSGQIQFTYAGSTAASSTSVSQPELTITKCRLVSEAQGLPGEQPTLSASFEVACPGAVCATAGVAGPWPLRPVKICVSGRAIFGPNPVVDKTLAETCKTAAL